MKIIMKNSLNNGSASRHPKSTKKSKVTKKLADKVQKDLTSSHSQEVLAEQTTTKFMVRETRENELLSPQKLPVIVKKMELEKRKQDGSEWKALKKVDYQRLETVFEEGQLSSEEVSSKHNFLESGKSDSGSDTDHAVADVAPAKSKKSWIHSLMSLADHIEPLKTRQDPRRKPSKQDQPQHKQRQLEKQQSENLIKPLPCKEKGSVIELGDSHGEPTESLSKEYSQSKRSVILSGMMEILPIFSNDKFVCSRDAISIEEYEDLEVDRGGGGPGKTLPEAKGENPCRNIDIKPIISANCIKKETGVDGRFDQKVGDFKEIIERKLRYKVFTDRNIYQQTSPFINSLLMLTSFSKEKERRPNEQNVEENVHKGKIFTSRHFTSTPAEGKCRPSTKVCFSFAMAALFLLTILISVAWKSYQPPRFVDSLIEALPFIRPRRSYLQLLLDKLVRFLSSCLGGMNLRFSSSNRLSEVAA